MGAAHISFNLIYAVDFQWDSRFENRDRRTNESQHHRSLGARPLSLHKGAELHLNKTFCSQFP